MALSKIELFQRRRDRVRAKLAKVGETRPRLSVHRSNMHMYVQLIDDVRGVTLASASTLEKDVRLKHKNGSNKAAAETVGLLIADRAKKAGVTEAVFDRGGCLFHGRVKSLAEAARKEGLKF